MAKDWKEVLLRSGVALEYEVGQLLASKGFDVDADFPYMRKDVEGEKEHSIDVMAEKPLYTGRADSSHINLLIECKYRSPEKTLLLFEAPLSPNTPLQVGGTVHAYDEFVPYYLKGDCFRKVEEDLPIVYKGVELHTNDAVERDFRRSVEQLRYAAPVALRRALDMTFFGHPADNGAWFFAKVVVTNARIMLVGGDVDVARVQAADRLEDVAEEIDGAILFSEYGPDYERHFKGVLDGEGDYLKVCLELWNRRKYPIVVRSVSLEVDEEGYDRKHTPPSRVRTTPLARQSPGTRLVWAVSDDEPVRSCVITS